MNLLISAIFKHKMFDSDTAKQICYKLQYLSDY